jgi:hypothetical protein
LLGESENVSDGAMPLLDPANSADLLGEGGFCTTLDLGICFAAGTPVLMADGTTKPIETLQPGDQVLSAPEHDAEGAVTAKTVQRVFHNPPSELIRLTIGGTEVRSTPPHLFYVREKGWTAAEDLEVGDELRTPDGRWVTLDAKQHQPDPEPVFNFRVADYHTYFVGDPAGGEAVLVHNEYDGQPRSDVHVVGNIIFYDGALGLPEWKDVMHLIIFRINGPSGYAEEALTRYVFIPLENRPQIPEDAPAGHDALVAAAAAKMYEMLKATPPRVAGVPTLTDDDLRNIAKAAAEVYVQVVQAQLKEWPGATPHNGTGWATWKEGMFGHDRDPKEVANDPVCVDWCYEMCTDMALALSGRTVTLSSGSTVNLRTLVDVKWAQDWHWWLIFEHNYPVIYPKGTEDADGRPSAYLILDVWNSLLPDLADSTKYRAHIFLPPFIGPIGAAQAHKVAAFRAMLDRMAEQYQSGQ